MTRLRSELARRWIAWLTPQDRQGFRAHVTIQNKVEPAAARALFESMKGLDLPTVRVEGLDLWRYRAGPWEAVATIRFKDPGGA